LARDFLTLIKPEVTSLVVAATFIGFWAGSPGPMDWALLLSVLLGTTLVAGGTAALNMVIEREADARMHRTAGRPVASGRMRAGVAGAYGLALGIGGVAWLALAANPLTGAVAFLTMASYLLIYTPLKSRTWLCTLVGAFPGAAPPLIGWAAATGRLPLEAWVMFAILFLWQFPHFLAIAWMYRQDYARGGIVMLPAVDPEGRATFRQIVFFTLALVPVSLVPFWMRVQGPVYLFGAATLGVAFLVCGIWAARGRTTQGARFLLHASVAYLPLLYALVMLDRRSL
jgi:protoheme IX farnesyltransferase